ncbi:HpcH/HpaI aldolase family protein [Haloarchaeobius sp. HRN-SO-5]|uniref:HpcH/HpaI aldolase family protein n=1 Tax=Haloarchaeobius sp. HRN-SO-5 TaxID=3446118 RepID=UPI003EB8AFC9
MKKNHVKKAIEANDSPLGTWISIGHPTIAEAAAGLDLDFVLVDMEHTTMGLETVETMARAVDAAQTKTNMVVRAPWNDPVQLKRLVDIGVAGVMVPMVGSAEEAEQLVEAIRYPPDGIRGIAGSRATDFGRNFEEYVTNANGSILTIAQIETKAGLDNADEIAAVDGIDALFVGPADLSGALDLFGDWESEAFQDALKRIVAAGDAADTPVGTLTLDIETIEVRVEQEFDFLIAGKDVSLLMDGIEERTDTYRNALDLIASAEDD